MRSFCLIAISVLLSIAAVSARAAQVSGQALLDGKSAAGNAVIYLEGGPKSSPMPHAMVDQRNKMFMPHVSVITRGTTVRFPNDDSVFHNVFAFYQAKKFDLGMYPRGATKTVTFDKTGLVVLLCNVHSDMSAFLMVVDTPYYAVSDRSGHFRIDGVAPGHYVLHAWHESGEVTEQSVDVASSGGELRLALARK